MLGSAHECKVINMVGLLPEACNCIVKPEVYLRFAAMCSAFLFLHCTAYCSCPFNHVAEGCSMLQHAAYLNHFSVWV